MTKADHSINRKYLRLIVQGETGYPNKEPVSRTDKIISRMEQPVIRLLNIRLRGRKGGF